MAYKKYKSTSLLRAYQELKLFAEEEPNSMSATIVNRIDKFLDTCTDYEKAIITKRYTTRTPTQIEKLLKELNVSKGKFYYDLDDLMGRLDLALNGY